LVTALIGCSKARVEEPAAPGTASSSASGSGGAQTASAAQGSGGGSAASGAGGGTSGGGGTMAPSELAPPEVALLFPPHGAIAATTVTVRGTAKDQHAIAAVTVNGVAAASDDGFATWSAKVPLVDGDNALVVSAHDELGNAAASAASVHVTRASGYPKHGTGIGIQYAYGAAVRADATRAYFCDDVPDGIVEVDIATGARKVIVSDNPADAHGPKDIVRPLGVDVQPTGPLLYMIDSDPKTIVAGDPTNDSHWTVSGPSLGTGPLAYPAKVRLSDDDHAYVLDSGLGTVLRYDLKSGARQPVAKAPLASPAGLGWSPERARLYTAEPSTPAIVQIDPQSGAGTVLSSAKVGGGVPLAHPQDVAVDRAHDEAIVWDASAKALLAVSLASGERRVLSSAAVGQGQAIADVQDVAVTRGWVLVLDLAQHALVAVDLGSGDRVVVAH
jgi:hypothetical protein